MNPFKIGDIIAVNYFKTSCYAIILTRSKNLYSIRMISDDPYAHMLDINRYRWELNAMYLAHVCGEEAARLREDLSI